jgi:hypothetical protein
MMSPRRGWDCQRCATGVCHRHEASGLQIALHQEGTVNLKLDEGEFSCAHSDKSF